MRKSFFWKMSTRVPLKGLFACQHKALVNKQTNKQNCQILFLTHVKCGDIERILNLGKHYAQRALTRFKMGNYSRTPPCMRLM